MNVRRPRRSVAERASDLPPQEFVKARRSEQGSFVGADGLSPIAHGHRIGVVREGLFEQFSIAGDRFHPGHRGGVVGVAETRSEQAAPGLLFHILEDAIPVNLELQCRVEDCGGVARQLSVADPARLRQCIGAVQGRQVAPYAAPGAVNGNSRVEKQHPTKIHAVRRDREFLSRRVFRKGLEIRLSIFEKLRIVVRSPPHLAMARTRIWTTPMKIVATAVIQLSVANLQCTVVMTSSWSVCFFNGTESGPDSVDGPEGPSYGSYAARSRKCGNTTSLAVR